MACLARVPQALQGRRQPAARACPVNGSPVAGPGVPQGTTTHVTRPHHVPKFSEGELKFPDDGGARGEGGFGSVRACYAPGLGSCVLKGARPGLDATAAMLAKEAACVGRLQHPHIVPLLGTVHDAQGALTGYLMAEASTSAYDVLGKRYDPLDIDDLNMAERLEVILQLFLALDHAHQHGVVHMDLKSANVLLHVSLARDGSHRVHVWVGDWGVAQGVGRLPFLDVTGFGSFDTQPPEQLRGRASTASDVYSAGCIAVNLLAGRPTIHGVAATRAEVKAAVLEEGFQAEIPPDLGRCLGLRGHIAHHTLQQCLQRNPDVRPSAATVVAVLEEVLHGRLSKSPPPDPLSQLAPPEAPLQSLPQAAQLSSPSQQPALAAQPSPPRDEFSSSAESKAAETETETTTETTTTEMSETSTANPTEVSSPIPSEFPCLPRGASSEEEASPPVTPPPPPPQVPPQAPPPGLPTQPAAAQRAPPGPPPAFPPPLLARAEALQGPPVPLQPGLFEPRQAPQAPPAGLPRGLQGGVQSLDALAALCRGGAYGFGQPIQAPLLSLADFRSRGGGAFVDCPLDYPPDCPLDYQLGYPTPLQAGGQPQALSSHPQPAAAAAAQPAAPALLSPWRQLAARGCNS